MNKPGRRKFVLAAGATAAAGLAAGFWWGHRPRGELAEHAAPELARIRDPAFPNPLRVPGADGMMGVIESPPALTIVAKAIAHPIIPGKPARMLAYEVEHDGKTFLNPVLKVRKGQTLRVKFWNALEDPSIIHWHGLKVDSNNDGHPHYAIPSGAIYDYQFDVANRAATYWYHPHPHQLTGKQIYLGLAGFFIVDDEEELALQQALNLSFGATDIPLVLQDRRFDADGQLVFAPTDEERLHGFLGSDVLVNATPRPYFDAATRIYRFRILNGSNARVYRLAFRHGAHLLDYQVIGNDGGLLDRPYTVNEAFLAPAERVDVLLDLRNAQVNDAVTLVSLPFDAMHNEAGDGADSAHGEHTHHAAPNAAAPAHAAAADGAELELLRINVRRKTAYDRRVPQMLARLDPPSAANAKSRLVTLDHAKMIWRINGATYDIKATPITVNRGSAEVWEVRNAARSMPHPMHIHGFQFRLIGRDSSPEQQHRLAMNSAGLATSDLGWKDTLLVWPGETVRLALDFSHPFRGDQVYMVHCHNLEHEDGGMMVNLKVSG